MLNSLTSTVRLAGQKIRCLFTAVASLVPASVCAEPIVDLCFENRDNSPYIQLDQSGLLIDLVNGASEETGIAIRFHPLPWKRCLTMVEQGGIDGALALVWNEERQSQFAYPLAGSGQIDRQRRIWQGEYLIVVPTDSPVQWDGTRFAQLEGGMASPLGYVSTEKLRQLNAFAYDSPPDTGLNLVAKNRLTGYVVQKEIGLQNLQSLGIEEQVKVLPIPFMTEDWYLVFSHHFFSAKPHLAEQLWQAIAGERSQLQTRAAAP